MQVLLKETVEALGLAGAEVKVAAGYARNYLFPRGKAMSATPENRKQIEQMRAKIELQIAKERAVAQEEAKRLEGVVCRITAKVGAEGRLYGADSTSARLVMRRPSLKATRCCAAPSPPAPAAAAAARCRPSRCRHR